MVSQKLSPRLNAQTTT